MNGQDSPQRRSRRRILSCDSCRRLKSRCEYDAGINACQRCHKLRIQCSLHSEEPTRRITPSAPTHSQENTAVNNDRIARLEDSLASVKDSVDQIWRFLQENARTGQERHTDQIAGYKPRGHEREQLETVDFPPPSQPGDNIDQSAPIMVVRKFRHSKRRLYKDQDRDIIIRGILREEIAERLISEFVLRLGPIIQVRSIGDLTSAASIRQTSPLLHAVLCLQALRFHRNDSLVNENVHRQLYEEVRDILGQVVLASPIPIEELYAMLIMCTFEAAPRPVYEYIESWHLSGICSQQAISTIDFAKIRANLRLGRHEGGDKKCLSLWNNVCLVNLRFAVGTGKPSTVPSDTLDFCPEILNHPQATIDDGMVLAEILLFSLLSDKRKPLSLSGDGQCPELSSWEKRWDHLLAQSEKGIFLVFAREFAYLLLAMRSVETCQLSGTPSSTHQSDQHDLADTFLTYAHEHALAMAHTFLDMPSSLIQVLPKFHLICIAYCSIVLAEYTTKSATSRKDTLKAVRDVCLHYRKFSDELPAAMNVALERMKINLDEALLAPRGQELQRPEFLLTPDRGAQTPVFNDATTNIAMYTHRIELEQEASVDPFGYELDLDTLPSVEDFFGSWMMDVGSQ